MKTPTETTGRRDNASSPANSHKQINPGEKRNRSSRRRLRCSGPAAVISPLAVDFGKEIKDAAVEYVSGARHKVSPVELQKFLSDGHALGARQARRIIRSLLTAGELSYTYEYGSSYLERSIQRPLHIGDRIVILPAGIDGDSRKPSVAVRINAGASFGTGRHPTTRLALQGLDLAVSLITVQFNDEDSAILDIGTGSGILAIAALQLGITRAVGIDPDPCARAEAAENAVLNGLTSRFFITDKPLSQLPEGAPFSMVTANLRYPTLIQMSGTIISHLATSGLLVLSGVKSEEQSAIMRVYGRKGLVCRWQATEKGWVALVLQRSVTAE